MSKDNGKGGLKAENNREYGGEITSNGIKETTPGKVSKPGQSAAIFLDFTTPNFHSHPSGTEYISGSKNMYTQHPSRDDIKNSGTQMNYVFGRGNGITYIYNNKGVQATIPTAYFINFRR
ncbi:MAG: hypothetical protein MJZ41_12515 [Bacteroidaceae bacterium]|nr:hypothetical protein [Bacteroidaceae bacterium]